MSEIVSLCKIPAVKPYSVAVPSRKIFKVCEDKHCGVFRVCLGQKVHHRGDEANAVKGHSRDVQLVEDPNGKDVHQGVDCGKSDEYLSHTSA